MSGWRLHPLVGAAREGEVSDLHFETCYYATIAWSQCSSGWGPLPLVLASATPAGASANR